MSQLRALLDRTLLATFRVSPPPDTLLQSLAVRTHVKGLLGDQARIIHYRQEMCPVTKKRLEKLRVLIEDLHRPNDTSAGPVVFDKGLKVSANHLTPAEQALVTLREPADIDGRLLELTRATRDRQEIQSLSNVDSDDTDAAIPH